MSPGPYPSYKPSCVPWLGDVPEHWEVRRLKQVCSRSAVYGANVAATHYQVEGVRFLRTTDIAESGQLLSGGVFLSKELVSEYVLGDGDILLSRSGTIGRSFLYSSELHGECAYAGYLVRFVPNAEILPKYLLFFTKAGAFSAFLRVMAIASTIENVNAEKYANMPIPLPPLLEQRAIVRYLDHADRRIRRYVGAKRKLIALLEEEKQAIINRAVTRGLDPNARLKPSGVEWLGDVPEHWEILPLKRWVSTKVTDGPHETPALLDDGIPFMSAESMVGGRLDFSRRRGFISREQHESYCRKCRPQRDDIFMCKSGATTGKVAMVETTDEFSVWSPLALIRVDPQRVLAHLLFAALQARYVRQQVQDTWSYGTQPNLSMGAMERLVMVLPPIDEQRDVFAYLDRATRSLSRAVDRARSQIDLLQEYRTRLIADVVTGKLDVSEAAALLPDDPEDEDPIDEGNPLAEDTYGDPHDPDVTAEELAIESEVTV